MCERGLKGEQGRLWGSPTVGGEREGDTMPGRCDRLRLCPQVELRSYVSEPELTTFSGDMAQPSLGHAGTETRYQTLPGRGKATLSMEAFWEPAQTCWESPHTANHRFPTSTQYRSPFCLQLGVVT